ncbi:hypothetical protein LBMAG42_11020 [Deltaproteobacteria bacterium]|nr:hypothetical protein LBMAG42_11020 [Deltaproteobacteria bacterium]
MHVEEASARVDAFTDGWISVVGPGGAVEVGLPKGWSVNAAWSADIITGATPRVATDAVSSATRFSELRNGVSVGANLASSAEWSAHGSYSGSTESDFVSHTAGAGAKVDAFGRMSTFSLDYKARFETTGRVDDDAYAETAAAHILDLGWTWILDRNTKGTVLATGEWDACSEALGCVASPYRKVETMQGLALSERHPDERGRVAAAVRVSRALGSATAVHGGYRLYSDTWAVLGHTVDLSLIRSLFHEALVLRGNARLARQGAASFWAAGYGGDSEWRTGDRDLGALTAWQAGVAVEGARFGVGPFSRLSLSAHLDHLWLRHDDFLQDTSHDAWFFGGGLHAAF